MKLGLFTVLALTACGGGLEPPSVPPDAAVDVPELPDAPTPPGRLHGPRGRLPAVRVAHPHMLWGRPMTHLKWPRVNASRIYIAKCPTGKHVLRGGMGALGVGQMWFAAEQTDQDSPEFSELPIRACIALGVTASCYGYVEEK